MKGIWKYCHLLPHIEEDAKLTLGEGNTPLVKSKQLGKLLGLDNLYFKLEIVNPSGSYKDRFAVCAIADLIQKNSGICIATSSGNTGSALAAYSAAAGIKCYLAIVDGAPVGKIQQMQVYGAETLMIKDFGIDPNITIEVANGLNEIARIQGIPVHISAYHYSPLAMAGVQTISYEIAEEIPAFNGHIFSPAGGGGLTFAIIKGFNKWKEINPQFKIPKIHCVQPEGNDTISGPLRNGLINAHAVSKSRTSISGLQVPNVIDGDEVLAGCRATGGTGYTVTDDDVYECQESLAKMEGIYCEPAGAVALAGVLKAVKNREIDKKDDLVCLVTGHGFKDPVSASKISKKSSGNYFNTANETFQYIKSQIKNK
ncbi:MAG TPA: pyridoxal-phosphate dependent enzyme [Hanamia sp.]|nr:pyridoxal-phosphate dependent enzyme [Hanamia sp.]